MRNKKVNIKFIMVGLVIGAGIIMFITDSIYKSQYVGVVGNTKIFRADYQKQLDQTNTFYTYSKQDLSQLPSLSKDVREQMINDTLVKNYAREHIISVTDTEIQNRYVQVIAGFNRNNNGTKGGDEAFLSRIKEMYGTDKNIYLEQIKTDILKEKVQAKVKMPLVKWLEEQKKSASINRY